ncbi:phage portal protein [Promicromonospora sp. NPDC023987]|uniref:phage portal protein n=1 Tax=Promicromonospora sp. NPDC023987 TaxID=3155360 RepID=UPI0033DDFB1B
MGLFNFAALAKYANEPNSAASGYVSPMNPPNTLAPIIVGDIFGPQDDADPDAPITRAEAMTIPSLVRARGILTIIASQPLVAYKGSERLTRQPGWLNRTDTSVSPSERVVATLDDLIFHGEALWVVERNSTGQIVDAVRMPFEKWRISPLGVIEVNVSEDQWTKVTNPKDIIYFRGFQEGLCTIGAPALHAARDIQRSVAARAKSPVPLLDLHLTDDDELTREEKSEMRREWNAALKDPEGSTAITPHNVEAKPLGAEGTNDFLTAARNGSRLDVANLLQLPASLIEGSTSTASLTYSTSDGKRSELKDYGLSLWMNIFNARLSMDDVTAAGTRIAFDFSDLSEVPDDGLSPVTED